MSHIIGGVYLGPCKGIQLVHSTLLPWSETPSNLQPPPVLKRLLQLRDLESPQYVLLLL
jgi:hypothetical protein